jgi:hypothetical protein
MWISWASAEQFRAVHRWQIQLDKMIVQWLSQTITSFILPSKIPFVASKARVVPNHHP